jgi:hypothetical protein
MDSQVARSMAKWPNVPAVYGWLDLDRRGNWRIRGQRILHRGLCDFISRNYQADDHGRWYFQNGPQRVFVKLAYTPLVAHYEDDRVVDQRGEIIRPAAIYVDDEGSVLIEGADAVALLDDRDLQRFADRCGYGIDSLPRIAPADVPARFRFVADPRPA